MLIEIISEIGPNTLFQEKNLEQLSGTLRTDLLKDESLLRGTVRETYLEANLNFILRLTQ